jgi:hypothetical protein
MAPHTCSEEIDGSALNLVCGAHSILAELPDYTSPLAQELPSDDVYFYYEDGETMNCLGKVLQRVVRVGSTFNGA